MANDLERITTVSLSVAHRDKLEWIQARKEPTPSMRSTLEWCIDQAVLAMGYDPESMEPLKDSAWAKAEDETPIVEVRR